VKVAIRRTVADDCFLCESPANLGRGLESTRYLTLAKADFADQADVNAYVTARGGDPLKWVVADLGEVGGG